MKLLGLPFDLRVALLYALFGGAWILSSDQLIALLVTNVDALTRLSMYKGWAFVVASSLLIFALLRRDLRLRNIANSHLCESEERFRTFIEQSSEGIVLVSESGAVLEWNQAMEHITGIVQAQAVHQPIWDILFQMTPSEQRSPSLADWQKAIFFEILQAKILPPGGQHAEVEIQNPAGQRKYVTQTIFLIETTNKRRIGAIWVDITERKRTEQALRESEEKFRSFVQSASEGFSLVDEHGVFIEWNPAAEKISGMPASQVLGKTIWEVQIQALEPNRRTPDRYEYQKRATLNALQTGQSPLFGRVLEVTLVRPEGNDRFIHQTLFPIKTNKGYRIGSVTSDITERRRAEKEIHQLNQELEQRVLERTTQLEAANKELEAFAYSVSHDLRAPLRHIDGFLELLQKRTAATLDERSQHYMATISHEAKRMGTLIDDLLSFSRMGRLEMLRMPVDLDALAHETIADLEQDTHGRLIHWQIGDLPMVSGDRAMLRAVFINLISNAVKFTRPRERAEIEIGWLPERGGEKEVTVFVRDNGVGFDMQYADNLFDVFQRLHRAEEFEGTGIGLANVRRIINRHGGRTRAEGKVDQGATFYISLPQFLERA